METPRILSLSHQWGPHVVAELQKLRRVPPNLVVKVQHPRHVRYVSALPSMYVCSSSARHSDATSGEQVDSSRNFCNTSSSQFAQGVWRPDVHARNLACMLPRDLLYTGLYKLRFCVSLSREVWSYCMLLTASLWESSIQWCRCAVWISFQQSSSFSFQWAEYSSWRIIGLIRQVLIFMQAV